ncbi:hypothetical protein ACQWFV_26160, partial [Salmonella enterica subsp. enterica serovar Infantis]
DSIPATHIPTKHTANNHGRVSQPGIMYRQIFCGIDTVKTIKYNDLIKKTMSNKKKKNLIAERIQSPIIDASAATQADV